jgi:hypothetical protein
MSAQTQYGYPPDIQALAIEWVLEQAKIFTEFKVEMNHSQLYVRTSTQQRQNLKVSIHRPTSPLSLIVITLPCLPTAYNCISSLA